MYNEEEELFKNTMRGVLQNYNAMYEFKEPKEKLLPEDMFVCCVVDGYAGMKEDDFKSYAREHKLFNEKFLYEKKFMEQTEEDPNNDYN